MASAVIGALRVVLGIDTALFDKGLADAQKTLRGVGQSMQSLGKSMSVGLTAPIAAFGALTLKTAGDFEASMNRVGAATGATGAELRALETLARDLGSSTSKSASESADMLEMLAKNGLDAEQILGGAAEAAIRLSEATGGDLSRSADVATNVMAQFGLQAKDMAHVVDQITGVTLASQFGFDDYALALGQAGGVAGALGVTLTDFNAVMASTSDVFNSGSDAGTSFKTFLTRLVPQSKPAAAAMEELGLEFFDAQGNMKSMADVAQELQDSLAGLSDEARTQALQSIFGQDAMRTAVAMAKQGAAGIQAATEQINKAGIAQEQAEARMRGFNGEMEKLSGAFEELQIAIAKSGLLAAMTTFVANLAEWVEWLAQTNPEILKWGTIVAAVAAAIGPLAAGLGLAVSGFAALLPLLAPIGVALAALVSPIGLVVAAFAGIAAAWLYWDEIKAALPEFGSAVETTVTAIKAYLTGLWEQIRLAVTLIVQVLQGDFAGALETLRQMFVNVGQTFLDVATVVFPDAVEKIKGIALQIIEAFKAIPGEMLRIGREIIDGLWNGINARWDQVKGSVRNIFSMIPGMAREETDTHSPSRVMHEIGLDIMQGLTNGMKAGSAAVIGVAEEVANALADTAGKAPAAAKQTADAWSGLSNVKKQADETGSSLGSMFSGFGSSVAALIKGTKSLREVLADVVAQFASSALQNGLKAMFGGSFGGGFSGFLSGLFGGLVGFSSGGTILPGGTGGIDSQLVMFRKSPNEQVDITKPGQRAGRATYAPTYNIDARGADQVAIARLERGLAERDRTESKRIAGYQHLRQARGVRA
ncbi:phage tail tape measure protein [Shinella sp. BYT-45]|uniref:phage tail tape measure protein n=1 Tax=Shinella sp. BYT-45 TaxID=3377377 RepID=UPI00398044A9